MITSRIDMERTFKRLSIDSLPFLIYADESVKLSISKYLQSLDVAAMENRDHDFVIVSNKLEKLLDVNTYNSITKTQIIDYYRRYVVPFDHWQQRIDSELAQLREMICSKKLEDEAVVNPVLKYINADSWSLVNSALEAEKEPMTIEDLIEKTGLNKNQISGTLYRHEQAGVVKKIKEEGEKIKYYL